MSVATGEETVQLRRVKIGVDADPSEKVPLTSENSTEIVSDTTVTGTSNAEKNIHRQSKVLEDPFKNDPKAQFICITIVVVILGASFVTLILSLADTDVEEPWVNDLRPRMLQLIPAPNAERNLIRFRHGKGAEGHFLNLTGQISQLLEEYSVSGLAAQNKTNLTSCDTSRPLPTQACFYTTDLIKLLCKQEESFGYAKGAPCVIIQLNAPQLFNWTPVAFTKDDLESNLTDIPYAIRQKYKQSGPYIECKGNTVVDIEGAGEIKIVPGHEFPINFFPYTGHPSYMAPLIALKFDKPKQGLAIGITCRVWSRDTTNGITEYDPRANVTRVTKARTDLPLAELPFNILVE